jgi:hypothetical protein
MKTRHAGLTCDDFAFMQAVTFATSGITSEQSRIVSGRARLTRGVADLGGGAIETTQKQTQ